MMHVACAFFTTELTQVIEMNKTMRKLQGNYLGQTIIAT